MMMTMMNLLYLHFPPDVMRINGACRPMLRPFVFLSVRPTSVFYRNG